MNNMKYNIFSLFVAQAVMLITIKVCLMIAGLLSLQFHASQRLATLPVALLSLGLAVGTLPALSLFHYTSRKIGHLIGILLGMLGIVLVIYAIFMHNFLYLNIACLMIGIYSGFAFYYRYTAADVSPPTFKTHAISYIIFAGVISAIAAPSIAQHSQKIIGSYPFVATFIILFVLNLIIIGLFLFVKLNVPVTNLEEDKGIKENTISVIKRYPFIVGTIATSICYLVMMQVMVATPIAMLKIFHFSFPQTSLGMQLHFLGMFAPGIIAGRLIHRFGIANLMLTGVIIYFFATLFFTTGVSLFHFYMGLLFLGLGWNLIFISGSSLVAHSYKEHEKNIAQGANNFITGLCSAIGALAAGPLLFDTNWLVLNLIVLPFSIFLLLIAIVYYRHQIKKP